MRVIVFLLMATVAVGGILFGYRLITGKELVDSANLGIAALGNSSARLATPAVPPTATPPPRPTPTPTPLPATATPVPDTPAVMLVGNTDGLGVYIRRTPRAADKIRAWQDGTKMEIIGPAVDSEGRKWLKVRAPDGVEGYIPIEFLVDVP